VSQVDKPGGRILGSFCRNHQGEEMDGQNSLWRISEIPSAVRSDKGARRLRPRPEFKLRRS
jgi:hypothetical protein